MSNRRVKSLAHEDDYDDYDDYEDDYKGGSEEELSPKDREQMRQGVIKVRASLGSGFSVTDNEIQEALWNYYYDVPKSVTYLKSRWLCSVRNIEQILTLADKKKPPPITKRQIHDTKSKSDVAFILHAMSPARGGHDGFDCIPFQIDADEHQDLITSATRDIYFSAVDFFKDSPWLKISEHRKAEIIIEPRHPRPRLLGGATNAGKPSKLAVLAAKRRQKESQSQYTEHSTTSNTKESYVSSLRRLRITQSPQLKPESVAATQRPEAEEEASETEKDALETVQEGTGEPDLEETLESPRDLRAPPSAFASIMITYDTGSHNTSPTDLFSSKAGFKSFNFAEPSPDDVVTKAQSAKGRT